MRLSVRYAVGRFRTQRKTRTIWYPNQKEGEKRSIFTGFVTGKFMRYLPRPSLLEPTAMLMRFFCTRPLHVL